MSNKRGLSLLEVALTASIIAAFVALLLPALGEARRQAGLSTCAAHLRQLGRAFRLYQDDYGEYPDPVRWVKSIRDRSLLGCPADTGARASQSSYTFRVSIPPDFKPYWNHPSLPGAIVIATCDNHLTPRPNEAALGGFKLVLRDNGSVEAIPVSKVQDAPQKGDQPRFVHIYPGEPGYQESERLAWKGGTKP